MSNCEIKNAEGAVIGSVELNDAVYGIEPNIPVMHQAVNAFLADCRQGTHSTKTRGMVSGGGKKPFRQKGLGGARQGTRRAPQWRGGGVVFGPHPRSYAKRINNKMVKLAMRSALSAKLSEGVLYTVDEFKFDAPSTKQASALLKTLGIEGRVTVILGDEDINAYLSFRNIPTATVISAEEANAYYLIDNAAILMAAPTAAHFGEVLA